MRLLDGLPFWGTDMKPYSLTAGVYSNGRIGMTVHGSQGPECKLTLNLPYDHLEPDEFFMPSETLRHALPVVEGLEALKLIEVTDTVTPYGVSCTATVWRFCSCEHYVVVAVCEQCVGKMIERYKAASSAKRLGGVRAAKKALNEVSR